MLPVGAAAMNREEALEILGALIDARRALERVQR